ncbi:MAG: hypothetical protein SNG45_07845 [Rikenellaceae bacterium]
MTKDKKIRNIEKFELAQMLFIHNKNITQKELAARVGVTAATLKGWAEYGEWEAKRTAQAVSSEATANGILRRIDEMLAQNADIADIAKLSSQLPKIHKKTTIYDKINFTLEFNDWVLSQQATNLNISQEFIRLFTQLQDSFINHLRK